MAKAGLQAYNRGVHTLTLSGDRLCDGKYIIHRICQLAL